ncbi:hypothetical protein FRD01_16220 [Microvenator marinus]|uniref:Uncharacterized protein n=1 Tax=Microvenator marinus TaxID=2600177 RepID=A0A5B8XT69_9DELT|nr:hypothetical protein [Microvenator marinus]QED28754.1 hypothetical protein FRD01_16220 [Microvenator marinus]
MHIALEKTFYARKPDSTVDELHMTVFEPVAQDVDFGAKISLVRNQVETVFEQTMYGVDPWQATMLGIVTLRLRVSLFLKKSYTSLHYTRECVEEGREITFDVLFPQV